MTTTMMDWFVYNTLHASKEEHELVAQTVEHSASFTQLAGIHFVSVGDVQRFCVLAGRCLPHDYVY